MVELCNIWQDARNEKKFLINAGHLLTLVVHEAHYYEQKLC